MNLLALVTQAPSGSARLLPNILMIGSFIAIFYFLILRPQKKLQTAHRAMIDSLKKGDEIMTEGGIIGQVVHIADDRVTVKSGESRVVIARTKIARVFTPETATEVK